MTVPVELADADAIHDLVLGANADPDHRLGLGG